ncbi:ATP synthase beta subunit/transription termination factor rho [Ketogulonicigenium robustum]|uniref:ATP synthase beta subunit/transription termination factor rho n=1 Tax=Ketogulonicigenium robustum TaxID=92947 RepID=A0A1W6NYB7_9RHOB|nr:SAM-dependent methyltransferase [Ketogulonicigenium robustum]ARO14090.1 ATP synthase beta subunit/transription termination factor rho [Ketogulonicigenium robustum]
MSLLDRIHRIIAQSGPISIADYMALCLLDPTEGYYTTQDAIGAAGDFITAPEISQVFGELIGLALAQAWLDQGCPAPFALLELGPGRGALIEDILRATRVVSGFNAALQLHLVEASPHLRKLQAARLHGYAPPQWHDTIDTLPQMPTFLVANEFLDALPIRQFQRSAAGWHERLIASDDGGLAFALGAPIAQDPPAPDGAIAEIRPAAEGIVSALAGQIAAHGGAAIFIDYGAAESGGDTFQAMIRHSYSDPLRSPGAADLTAHVAFGPLARAATAAGAAPSALVAQGEFLLALGLQARSDALIARMAPPAAAQHKAAMQRLIDPAAMGSLFKVMGVTPTAAPAIAGLPLQVHSVT